jgi:hypothetical protein
MLKRIFLCLVPPLLAAGYSAAHAEVTATEVVKNCYYKDQGQDQKTRLAISIENMDGNVSGSEYIRLWKDYAGDNGFEEKMVLYTVKPKEAAGVNFMRWAYTSEAAKPPEQWVYLPELKKVRRVSQRDPNDMTWGLTDEDFRIRQLDEDEHNMISQSQEDGKQVYLIESIPRGESSYSKWVTRYENPGDWQNCNRTEVEYYDKEGKKLKHVSYSWLNMNGAWVWDTVTIKNNHSLSVVTYKTLDANINVGLGDRDFSERMLRRDARSIQ